MQRRRRTPRSRSDDSQLSLPLGPASPPTDVGEAGETTRPATRLPCPNSRILPASPPKREQDAAFAKVSKPCLERPNLPLLPGLTDPHVANPDAARARSRRKGVDLVAETAGASLTARAWQELLPVLRGFRRAANSDARSTDFPRAAPDGASADSGSPA